MNSTPNSNPCAGKSGVDLANCIASSYGSQGIIPPSQVNAKSGQQITSDVSGVTNLLGSLTSPSTWVRVGIFLFALVFVIVGFMVVVSENK